LIKAVISKYCRGPDAADRADEIRKLCSKGKPSKSVKTYEDYLQVIKGLRIVAEIRRCSLFEVESLWDDKPRAARRKTG
jgi:hypothetical protein